jgi:hypothetical protein
LYLNKEIYYGPKPYSAKERTNLLEESSTDGCGISENEVESTQNNNSSQV